MAFPGHILKTKREQLGLTPEQIVLDHAVPAEIVRALEASDIQALPEPIFTNGFLRTYCRLLDIEEESMITELQVATQKLSETTPVTNAHAREPRVPKIAIPQLALGVPPEFVAWASITALVILGWFTYNTVAPFETQSTQASMVDTRTNAEEFSTREPETFGFGN